MRAFDIPFRSVPADDLVHVEWNGHFVLFHRPSGRTHFVNDSTWLLLDRVLREPRDVSSATEEFVRLAGLPLDDEVRSHVRDLFVRLDEIGLIVAA